VVAFSPALFVPVCASSFAAAFVGCMIGGGQDAIMEILAGMLVYGLAHK
jgi:hypothetical protein